MQQSKSPSRIKLLKLLLIGSAVAMYLFYGLPGKPQGVKAFSSGPPFGHTGAPGEATCVSCHTSFDLNSGSGGVRISSDLPINYSPNQEVPITVTVDQLDGIAYGFQLTALDETGQQAGRFVVTDRINTRMASGTIDGRLRRYVEHTLRGSVPVEFDQRQWTFTWVAPPTDVGPVTFYIAGNGANGDGESTNDFIYTASVVVPSTPPPAEPADYTVAAEPSVQTVAPGEGASYIINAAPLGGFSEDVTFEVSGLPDEATVVFDPPLITAFGSSTMTVTTSPATPAGIYSLTVTGSSSSQQRAASVTLTVAPDTSADLSLSQTTAPTTATVGSDLTYTITVTNNGTADATMVGVTAGLPDTATLNSVTSTQGECSFEGGVVTCYLDNLANGAAATIEIVVTPTVAGEITTTACVSGGETDPDSSNNAQTVVTTVEEAEQEDTTMVIKKTGATTFN